MSEEFEAFDRTRLELLLEGVEDPTAPAEVLPTGIVPRRHYFLRPRAWYRPGDEEVRPHAGLLSLRTRRAGEGRFRLVGDSLIEGARDTGLRLVPVEEEKAFFYTREGGVLCFDLNPCRAACRFCARIARRRTQGATLPRDEREAVHSAAERLGRADLSGLRQLSVVTGVFGAEAKYLAHVTALLDAAVELGFQGDLYLATDELRSAEGMRAVRARTPGRVYFSATIEAFTRRSRLMPGVEHEAPRVVLERAAETFGRAFYNCIAGLDPLADTLRNIRELASLAVPYVSVFSVYHRAQERLYADGARQVGFHRALQQELLGLFGARAYMHDAPLYNVTLRALLPFPEDALRGAP